MKLGILSDTHEDRMSAIPCIIREFKKNGVQIIIHCGDIIPEHISPELFGNLPVFCALTEEQVKNRRKKKEKNLSPEIWNFTRPNDRIRCLTDSYGESLCFYLGHKRSFEILTGSEQKLLKTIDKIRKGSDNIRYLFSGHTHHQILMKTPLITFINPGAVENPIGIAAGHEFAIIDTSKGRVVFSRIPTSINAEPSLRMGVISDSLDISKQDKNFWKKLAAEFNKKGVTHFIHCGNLNLNDIGREELKQFEIFFNLRKNQSAAEKNNWHLIDSKNPVVTIGEYKFYVQWELGSEILEESEREMDKLSRKILRDFPEVGFILFGFTRTAFYEEGQHLILLNPGDIIRSRSYAIISLPEYELTFGRIPYDSLSDILYKTDSDFQPIEQLDLHYSGCGLWP